MIRELIAQQNRYLNSYFQQLDCAKAEQLLELVRSCKGTLILSGVGKSGHIAQKIAATFLSTGTKAFFLDPMHAVHGDLGFVSGEDLFLAFSKSGESQELLELVPFVRNRGSQAIALISNSSSRLAKISDFFLELPVERELCPYDLAPTTSTSVQLLFGDCLAIALMSAKRVSLNEFALNHPSGFLGRKIALKVSDLMLKSTMLPLCASSDLLLSVLPELSSKRCGCLLVADETRKLSGIFTDGDLRRALERMGSAALNAPLSELMTRDPRTVSGMELAWEALRKMESKMIMMLPVLEQGIVVGLIRMHDILQAGLSLKKEDREQIQTNS